MNLIERLFFRISDACVRRGHYPLPTLDQLQQCKIISHRGEHAQAMENTFAAFDPLVGSGVWAIEFDLRWTRDLQPVVFHDADCQRLFNHPVRIADLTLAELQARFPSIPSLESLLNRYRGQFHFMIELKKEAFVDRAQQSQRLKSLLSGLMPAKDFHIISLSADKMFPLVDFLPSQSLLPIVHIIPHHESAQALTKKYGGLLGHYRFITSSIAKKHWAAGQKIGVGFIHSQASLQRELSRGIEWIYTDEALALQKIINTLKQVIF